MEWFGSELHIGQKCYEDVIESYKVIDNIKKVVDTVIIYGDKDTIVTPEASLDLGERL